MSNGFDVRFGTIADLEKVMPIMADAFDPEFGEAWTRGQCVGLLSLPGTALFVALNGPTAIGFAICRYVLDESELLLIAVVQQAQQQGVGREILGKVIDWAHSNGSRRLFLEMREGNPAKQLYDSVEFVQVGRRKDYYRGKCGVPSDAITMEKNVG
ncbi:MAG: hypothetical protein RIS52_434 [Pseudomonadota bacterium]|jgi:[ribosomal protein S18]-alanine N-acetyltransferase